MADHQAFYHIVLYLAIASCDLTKTNAKSLDSTAP